MRQKIFALLLTIFIPTLSFAQYGNDCLGIWRTVTIDLNQTGMEVVCTIPTPLEGVLLTMPNQLGTMGPVIQGPGSPRIYNVGSTIDIHLRKAHLLLEYEANPSECLLELFVNKQVSDWGVPTQNGNQCYYYIRLLLTK